MNAPRLLITVLIREEAPKGSNKNCELTENFAGEADREGRGQTERGGGRGIWLHRQYKDGQF